MSDYLSISQLIRLWCVLGYAAFISAAIHGFTMDHWSFDHTVGLFLGITIYEYVVPRIYAKYKK